MTQRVAGLSYSVRLRPTISATAYTAADQVGGVMSVDCGVNAGNISQSKGRQVDDAYVIQSIKVIDEADQKAELILSFFNISPTNAGNDAAVDYTDDELQANFLGHVTIAAADYISYADNAVATVANVGLQLKPLTRTGDGRNGTSAGDDIVYCVAHTTGTPTYGATDALGIVIDLSANV